MLQEEANRIKPVRKKIEQLEEQKRDVSRGRSEAEADSWSHLESLRVSYEGLKKTSDAITR